MLRISLLLLLGLLGLLGSVAVGVWAGQDRIIGLFVTELNRYLRVPVQASRLEVSVLDQFPRLSLTLHNVVMAGANPTDTVRLARARRLYCAFDATDLLAGRYRIRAVTLADAQVHVRRDAQGRPNYLVLRPDTTSPPDDRPFGLELEGIKLERVAVTYEDAARRQHFGLHTPALRAALTINGDNLTIAANGTTYVRTLRVGPDDYFANKTLELRTTLGIDRARQLLTLQPSEVRVGPAAYTVAGTIGYQDATQLNLRCDATHTTVQAVLALLPPRLTRRLAGYRSRGNVYFGGTVRGEWSGRRSPTVTVDFGCREASFFHPEYRQAVEQVSLRGSFRGGGAGPAVLALDSVRGQLAGRPFGGSLRLENFTDPTLNLHLRADVDVARAARFFPVAAVRAAAGQARLTLHLAGRVRELRSRASPAQASGELEVRGVRLQLRDFRQPFTALDGRLQLAGSDVLIPILKGRLGTSDFQARGTLRNATGWLLRAGQPLRLEATVAANLLDFNQLLYVYQPVASGAAGATKGTVPPAAGVRVPAGLDLQLTAQARHVRFRRLRGSNLRGALSLHGQVFSSPGLSLTAAGGQVSVRGTVDARQPQLIKAHTLMSCQQLPLDSLFYVFEDFGQQFLTTRHVRGTLTATADADTYFDQHLSPLTDRLEAEVQATVRNGELLNFEPLQKLSFVASRATLRHLRFAELHNRLYVQSRTVYIPEMDIRSNVRAASLLQVTGTHTFDQRLDYHVRIPLLPGLLPRAAAQAKGPALRLAIQGTEDNFAVRYEQGPAAPATTSTPAVARGEAANTPPAAQNQQQPTHRPTFELKKPAKKPTQPQTGEYFDF